MLSPIGKAATCLESTHSTVSDVFVFWLGVMLELHDVVTAKNSIPTEVKEGIRAAANKRWKQMFGDNDAYLTGLVLDPRYRGVDLGVKDLNPLVIGAIKLNASNTAEKPALPSLVRRAGTFLLDMLRKELRNRSKDGTVVGLEPRDAVERVKDLLPRFVKGTAPFNARLREGDGPQQWWKRLNEDKSPDNPAQPLAVSMSST